MTWRRVTAIAGVGMAVLLLAAAIGFRDLEAAILGLGVFVALALLRLRTGLLGLVGLGLLGADVAAWMIPGAVSNLSHGGTWVATTLPSALAVTGVATLVGALGSVAERKFSLAMARWPTIVAVVAGVLLVASIVVGAARQEDRRTPGVDVALVSENVRFSREHVVADKGRLAVSVENLDLFWHTFTIRKLGVDLKIPVQATRMTTFDARPGVYEFICAIPGHVQAGMKGTLTVR